MSLIYWDTMLFVYWFEEHPAYVERIQQILARMEQRKDTLCTSSLRGRRELPALQDR